VLATLFEKHVEDFKIKPVDLATGEHKKPEYLKLQPFGVIPVLQDGDFNIFESRAIARYISEKFENQGTPLFGEGPKDRALVNQWLEVESQNYNPLVSSIVAQVVFYKLRGLATDEKVVEEQLAKLEKVLDVYEAHLSKNKYLAGNFFSIADLSHLPYTHYLVNVAKKGEGVTSRKHVNAWWEDISSRPAWKKVLELQAKK
jgi:glutathione S-transferase